MRFRELAGALSALATAAAVHGQPRVIYVDASNTGAHSGSSWGTAFRDLQEALFAANNAPERSLQGVEIRVSQGVYTPDHGTLNPATPFVLNSGVTLMGGFAGLLNANPDQRDPRRFVSVLSGDLNHDDGPGFANYGDNARTIVLAQGGSTDATLDGFEISGGNADSAGIAGLSTPGVISSFSASGQQGFLGIRNCTITRNRAATGPVLKLNLCRVANTRIIDNRTQNHSVLVGSNNRFEYCDVRGNRVVYIGLNPSLAMFSVVRFYSQTPTDHFIRCVFADNSSGANGMFYSYESSMALDFVGCTIANNSAPASEVITSQLGRVRLRNCVVAGNVRNAIPSLPTQIAVASPSMLDVDSTVLIDNGAAAIRLISSSSGTISPFLSGDPGFASPTGPDHDPTTWVDNNYHLRSNSPGIDRANSSELYPYFNDLDGRSLYDDPNAPNLGTGPYTYADLGAYESDGSLCPADFNRSGTLTVADIFDFLNAWLGNDARADFDGGGLAVSDIFAFINAWLAGC